MSIAAAVFLARKGKSKKEIKEIIYDKFGYEQLKQSVSSLRKECKWSAACQDTVPMAIVAFLESEDYISAIKLAISYGSDSDTICAMAGAIAEAYYKSIPNEVLLHCKAKLPSAVAETCEEFVHVVRN